MTTKQKFIEFLKTKPDLQMDRWGNFKSIPNGTVRYKLGKTSVRFEKKLYFEPTEYSKGHTEWFKMWSAYYKNIEILDNGKIKINKKN